MKKETTKSPKNKAIQDKDSRWINVHDDAVMREMGFSRFDRVPRDESVWTKTPKERQLLKKMKHTYKDMNPHFHSIPPKRATFRAKLIIQLKPNNIFPKSTYSQECLNTHISDVLEKFEIIDSVTRWPESIVAKYSYNGRTYAPNELPYYG